LNGFLWSADAQTTPRARGSDQRLSSGQSPGPIAWRRKPEGKGFSAKLYGWKSGRGCLGGRVYSACHGQAGAARFVAGQIGQETDPSAFCEVFQQPRHPFGARIVVALEFVGGEVGGPSGFGAGHLGGGVGAFAGG
jgi:hypothetical protein